MKKKAWVLTLSEYRWDIGEPVMVFDSEKALTAFLKTDEAYTMLKREDGWPFSGYDWYEVEKR